MMVDSVYNDKAERFTLLSYNYAENSTSSTEDLFKAIYVDYMYNRPFKDVALKYLSLVICFFGIIFNLLIIVVRRQKDMRSATNTLLTCLAGADCVLLAAYASFVVAARHNGPMMLSHATCSPLPLAVFAVVRSGVKNV